MQLWHHSHSICSIVVLEQLELLWLIVIETKIKVKDLHCIYLSTFHSCCTASLIMYRSVNWNNAWNIVHFWCRGLRETSISYPYWIVSIVGPFTFFAAFSTSLLIRWNYLMHPPAISRIAGAIVSALKSPPDGSYCCMTVTVHTIIITCGDSLTAVLITGSISEYLLPDRAWHDFVCPWSHYSCSYRVGQQIQPWINLTFAGSLLATHNWVSLD